MALDCYICKQESDGRVIVHRYKAKELLDSESVFLREDRVVLSKREKIARHYLESGKPKFAVYWFEGTEIKSKDLAKRVVVGSVANGYAQVWDKGVLKTIRIPKGMSDREFEDVMHQIVGIDTEDALDWIGVGGIASLTAYGGTIVPSDSIVGP